jgi:serine/threonine-protein kinase ATR
LNLKTIKELITVQYGKKGPRPPNGQMQEIYSRSSDKIARLNELKKLYYPVLGQWMRQRFSSPQAYFRARQAYTKTVAIMSMIGYIMGLGDRHNENILVDQFTGEILHVDYNYIFHRAESLK